MPQATSSVDGRPAAPPTASHSARTSSCQPGRSRVGEQAGAHVPLVVLGRAPVVVLEHRRDASRATATRRRARRAGCAWYRQTASGVSSRRPSSGPWWPATAFSSGSSTASSSPTSRATPSIMRTPASTWPISRPSSLTRDRDARAERLGPADVVQQRRRQQQVAVQARVHLRRPPGTAPPPPPCARAGRRRRRGACSEAGAVRNRSRKRPFVQEPCHQRGQAGIVDLGGQELDHAVQRLGVTARARHQLKRVARLQPLQVADRDLRAGRRSSRRDPARAPCRPRRTAAQHVDVVPDHCRDAAGAVGQLQRQERVTVAGASAALALHRERGLDQRTFLQLGDVGAFGHRRVSLFHRPGATRLTGTDGRHRHAHRPGAAASAALRRRSVPAGGGRRAALRRDLAGRPRGADAPQRPQRRAAGAARDGPDRRAAAARLAA